VSLYAGLSIRENVEFYAGLYGLDGGELERRWGALRERFALGDAEREKPEDLPAGIRQRAGLALSTLHNPRVLLLDEPTAGVDVRSRALFWELIQDEAAAGTTVFVTTHFLEEVEYCDWACFIDAGRLIANAAPEDLRRRYAEGYTVDLALPAAERAGAAAAVAAPGVEVATVDGGLRLTVPSLEPPLLATLDRLARLPGARVGIDQPSMTEVFRRLLAEASAQRSAA
jgi:ABC-2 type transport system ATP-binding protein